MISPLTTTRLRKAAVDNGFDLEQPSVEPWLLFVSTKAPLKVWLTGGDQSAPTVALSQPNVAQELSKYGLESELTPPPESVVALDMHDFEALHHFLRRAFQLSRALPYELLREFEETTVHLPRTTETERLVVQRIGQDMYRQGLIEYWEGRCAITGLDIVEILRASHSKPWADCANDAERLDVFNGFLLAPHLDAVFDRGFLTIADGGSIVFSARLSRVS